MKKNFLKIPDNVFVLISAILLIFAFPKWDYAFLIWFALAPLLFVLEKKNTAGAFRSAYLCGLLFFSGVFYGIVNVTLFGYVLLCAYCAVYFGLFGLGVRFFRKAPSGFKPLLWASLWVALEYGRAHLFTGFGWASLGLSQYRNLLLIQIADITGVYGISFLIVFVSGALKIFLQGLRENKQRRSAWVPVLCAALMLAGVLWYGQARLSAPRKSQDSLTVAIVQPNILMARRWNESQWPKITREQIVLGEKFREDADLIIFSESAIPGILPYEDKYLQAFKDFAVQKNIPVLVGSVVNEGEAVYYNSALLLSAKGVVVQKYDKLHLVPYGEYIPFRQQMPFLKYIVPIDDFTPGRQDVIFQLPQRPDYPFAVLICFEDGIPEIARRFVQKGAQVLVNMTNDDWFKDTNAPWMHLQSSVFRAVENRRLVVRSANTGISCAIDPGGSVLRYVADQKGKKAYVRGGAVISYGKTAPDRLTFYTKYGDVFTYLCFGCILFAFLIKLKNKIHIRTGLPSGIGKKKGK